MLSRLDGLAFCISRCRTLTFGLVVGLASLLSAWAAQAQTRVSVGFEEGFIGEYSNQAHAPTHAQTFATLGIQAAVISQLSDNGLFGGSQGNDYVVDVTFLFNNGSSTTFTAAVNWRDTQGSAVYAIGLIGADAQGNPVSNPVDGSSYVLTSGRSKTYALELVGSPRVYVDTAVGVAEPSVSGNAATSGLLDALNAYLQASVPSGTPSALTAVISAADPQIDADGTSTTTITIQLKDVNGNDITTGGYPVTLATDYGTLLGTLVDNGDGTYTQVLRSAATPGTATLTGTLDADGAGGNPPAAIVETAQVVFTAVGVAAIEGGKTVALVDNDSSGALSDGDVLTYTITATNTGDLTLSGVTVQSDSLTQADGTPPANAFGAADFTTAGSTTLAAGESAVFTASYTVAQADVDAGGLINSAVVAGTPPSGPAVTDTTDNGDDTDGNTADDSTALTVLPDPSLELVLMEDTAPAGVTQPFVPGTNVVDMDGDGTVSPGDRIYYTYSITNTGNVTVSGISVDQPGVIVSGGPISLAPGEQDTSTFYGYRVIEQADIDAGQFAGSATATGSSPSGSGDVEDVSDDTGAGSDPTVTDLGVVAAMTLVKTATLADVDGTPGVSAGDRIDYVFELANTGNVSLTAVAISEQSFTGTGSISAITLTGGDDGNGVLDVGETWVYAASYTITAGDISGDGAISNLASASAQPASGGGAVNVTSRPSLTAAGGATTVFLGSIAGVVLDGGVPVAGVTVILVDAVTGAEVLSTVTGADGSYAFVDVPAGRYRVVFQGPDGTAFNGADHTGQGLTAGMNVVQGLEFAYPSAAADRILTGVDAVAVDPGGIVYDAATRQPVSGATVTLLFGGSPVDASWLVGGSSTQVTASDGSYGFFLQSPAQSGTYTLQVSGAGYAMSTTIVPQAGAYVPALGGGVEAIVASAMAPSSGGDTTYYMGFDLTFGNWMDLSTLSNGIIHNHIALEVVTPEILPQIEDELKRILEEDLRLTVRRQMRRFSALSASALERLRQGEPDGPVCGRPEPFDPDGAITAQGQQVEAGLEGTDRYFDCATGRWVQRDVTASYDHGRTLGHQYGLTYTELRERFVSEDRLRGWFWGGYLGQTEVDHAGNATGNIQAADLHLGRYGADRYESGLVTDHYGALAIGRHEFDLEFGLDTPARAEGGYSYAALFAGFGLSGQTRSGPWAVAPSLRFDGAYAFAGDASVAAVYVGLPDSRETGSIALEDQYALRATGEVLFTNGRDEDDDADRGDLFSVAPRVFCDLDATADGIDCGYGGYVAYDLLSNGGQTRTGLRVDVERRGEGDYSLDAGISHRTRLLRRRGSWENSVAVSRSGEAKLSTLLQLDF